MNKSTINKFTKIILRQHKRLGKRDDNKQYKRSGRPRKSLSAIDDCDTLINIIISMLPQKDLRKLF